VPYVHHSSSVVGRERIGRRPFERGGKRTVYKPAERLRNRVEKGGEIAAMLISGEAGPFTKIRQGGKPPPTKNTGEPVSSCSQRGDGGL